MNSLCMYSKLVIDKFEENLDFFLSMASMVENGKDCNIG